ncbi:MAG TPA: thioredoxin domain-containing protein, partial [Candidatus Xenobia bacterium]|nr:thioredoxin domain-containing protein [Candidatus Xenobia bacterium]
MTQEAPKPNRLQNARSAYLSSAAHQPVDWHQWSEEAFARARAENKPILLDIGAVWCHWCHVMDGESYEDPGLAEFLNEHFVCVKVDRDERPDVDARYQRAVQALTGQGGWPLTAFLTPDGRVFYGGTYFPPDGKYGRPGFRSVLERVAEIFRTQRDRVEAQAEAIRGVIEEHLDESAPGELSPGLLAGAVRSATQLFDPRNGGFGTAPKFPHPAAITLLLHRWHDGAEDLRPVVEQTLVGMARGGIHDQLGGGFHRYSVDAEWIVPHFEKMTYDNAELLKNYLDAYAAFGREEYAEVARGVVRWVREVVADPAGGYAASQDADVGLHDDGDYFTWTHDEAAAVLDPDELAVAAAYYDIGAAGEMSHNPAKNVLYVATTLPAVAAHLGLSRERAAELLASARAKLILARAVRPAPFVDRTRYANWNAMMASAMLRAGAVLADEWAAGHALLTLGRLRAESAEDDAVAHTPGGVPGLLDDQVQVAQAALDAHEHAGDDRWLEWGVRLMERVWRDYRDEAGGGLWDTARDRGGEGFLAARAKPVQDAPTPSANGTAGVVCARLHELTGDARWADRRDELLRAFAGRAAELGLYGATYFLALDWALHPATHLVVVGARGDAEADRMHRQALATFVPRRVVRRMAPDAVERRALPAAL